MNSRIIGGLVVTGGNGPASDKANLLPGQKLLSDVGI